MNRDKIEKISNILKTTPDETIFMLQSVVKGYNDIVARCSELDKNIAMFMETRASLQPSLEAATSLATKVQAVLAPEVTPHNEGGV